MRRAQLSLSLVEAGLAVLVVFAVTATFLVGVQAPDGGAAQLDRYAADASTILAAEPGGGPTLGDALASAAAFDSHRGSLGDRLDGLLPPNVLYRLETPRGTIGYPRPPGARAGSDTVATTEGRVTVWVWYP
jgi:hypothetical protein